MSSDPPRTGRVDCLEARHWIWLPVAVVLLVSMSMSCRFLSSPQATDAATSSLSQPTRQPDTLATPYADQPAAGICARPETAVVQVRLLPGIPEPRCTIVGPTQRLSLTNAAERPLSISIGIHRAQLAPGASWLLDQPFGAYLAPGVHRVLVDPCCSPELVLEIGSE